MEIKDVPLWQPIRFSENWEQCSSSKLDAILPSWLRKRERLKENANEYTVFMDRLKRQHAIETGIVEKLYDLSEGVTVTFIKEGFIESYLQHGDTNIPAGQLMAYLQDNLEALDFAFDVVKNNRPLTTSFIKELHQLITRHQNTAEGQDLFGNRLQIPLLKGAFKESENNPTRPDGTRFIYCPPIHVEAEMDKLVAIYTELEERKMKPVVLAAWLHHAFVAIHPFQDANGRVARLLASLVLIKHELFPLTVKRNEKKRYLDALELADRDEPQALVDFFSEVQKKNIEAALSLKLELAGSSFEEVAEIFSRKLEQQKQQLEEERQKQITENRLHIFDFCSSVLNDIKTELESKVNGNAKFRLGSCRPGNQETMHYFTHQIAAYATQFKYFFNRNFPRAWFRFVIELAENRKYQLIITLHHFGYDDTTLAIGAILEFDSSNTNEQASELPTLLPLPIEPFTLSLQSDPTVLERTLEDVKSFLQNVVTLTLAQIASEIS